MRFNSYSQESFASGTQSVYMDQMYEQWKKDHESVNASWKAYFTNIEQGAADAFTAPPNTGESI